MTYGECLCWPWRAGRGEWKLVLCSFATADLRLSIKIVGLPRRPKFCFGTQVRYLTTPIPGYPISSFGFHVYPILVTYTHVGKHTYTGTGIKSILCCRGLGINITRMNSLKSHQEAKEESHCHRSLQIATGNCSRSPAGEGRDSEVLQLYIHAAQMTTISEIQDTSSVTA